MTRQPPPSPPRTAAGRELAGWDIANSDDEQAELVAAIRAIEAAAPAGLDVERLTQAINNGVAMYWKERPLPDGSTEAVLDADRYAADLAAEYARLSQGTEGER